MGKSLIIPGADFSAVAIPFIAKVTIAANKQAVIYNGNSNVFATIEATAQEKTVDLTDILSVNNPTLFDFTFAREHDVFKKVWVNLDDATTMEYLLYVVDSNSSILNEVNFSGSNSNDMNIGHILFNQNNIRTIDLSGLSGQLSAEHAFNGCENVKSINMHNATSITSWTSMFRKCSALKTIDLSSLETISSTTPEAGSGPFLYCSNLETILCPALGVSGAKIIIKELSAGPSLLCKYSGGNIIKVDMSRFTYQSGTPDPATMTLWDENVWDNPVMGTTYYVDVSVNRLYTYNG